MAEKDDSHDRSEPGRTHDAEDAETSADPADPLDEDQKVLMDEVADVTTSPSI